MAGPPRESEEALSPRYDRRVPKSRPGTCTYCLRDVERVTDDHVFPSSWYAADTPSNLQKARAPACAPCNNERYSKIEARLRQAFALSFGLDDPRVAGVQGPALRGIDPDASADPTEKRVRAASRSKFLRAIAELSVASEPPAGSTMIPGFGPDEPGADSSIRVGINAGDFHDFAEKIVRGMTFVETGRLIVPEYLLETWLASEAVLRRFGEMAINPSTSRYGSAFVFTSTREPERDPVAGAFVFTIWGRLHVAASVQPRDA